MPTIITCSGSLSKHCVQFTQVIERFVDLGGHDAGLSAGAVAFAEQHELESIALMRVRGSAPV